MCPNALKALVGNLVLKNEVAFYVRQSGQTADDNRAKNDQKRRPQRADRTLPSVFVIRGQEPVNDGKSACHRNMEEGFPAPVRPLTPHRQPDTMPNRQAKEQNGGSGKQDVTGAGFQNRNIKG